MSTSTLFRTSININYDIGEPEFLRNYLPTPSHAESIISISKGFLEKNSNSAHIMIGPYGSGKSLLATVIASMVSKKVDEKHINYLIAKFNAVHQNVFKSLSKLNKLNKVYVPVILNGSYPDFGDTLIEAIQESLLREGIEINLPTERNSIINTVLNWKEKFPNTYDYFLNKLNQRSLNYNKWELNVKKGNYREVNWFKNIYPELTSGASFNSIGNSDFNKNLEYILSILRSKNIGLFIIHDEFGRFLQNLEPNQVYKSMQELQDIAEFVNRSDQHIQLLLISHKGMSQYMIGLNETHQSEFQRIEKRYATYFVESDTATFYRIVNKYLSNQDINLSLTTQEINQSMNQLRMFNLYQNINQHELENLIIKGCYPLHPIAMFLLPRISKIFGQNERTLFTYLESSHSYGFQNQLKKRNKDSYIFADSLFPYFFTDEILSEIHDETTKENINTYQIIKANLDARKVNAHRIIDFIMMWEITNSNNIYKLDFNLLQFSTNIPADRLKELLQELSKMKFIRFNRIQNKLELSEGSSVVVDSLVQQEKTKLKINNNARIDELSKLVKHKYYLSRTYNDEKNITRFMKVKLISEESILNEPINAEDLLIDKSDGAIYLIVIQDIQNLEKVKEVIKSLKHPRIIIGLLTRDVNNIYHEVDNLIAVKELLLNKKLLLENKNLKEELTLLVKDYEYKISNFLNSFSNFDSYVDWFHNGINISLNNQIELEEKISEIMWDQYSETPTIMNDSVNRYNVVGIQRRSLHEVTNRVLNNAYEENIGIEGQGPDYLIYATVIKNQGISFKDLNNIENNIFKSVRNELINHLKSNNTGTALELYNILHSSPYGIRPPLIPLILVSLLRDKWDHMMFYRNDIFVPALEGEKIYELFKEPEHYQYVYHDFDTSTVKFMTKLEYDIKSFISEYVLDETQLIRVSSGLLNWLRSLPRQVQITEMQEDVYIQLKSIIRRSEINPIQSIEDLISLVDGDYDKLRFYMNELENMFPIFKKRVLNKILELFKVNDLQEIKKLVKSIDNDIIKRNRLLNVLSNANNIESIALSYVGTKLDEWSDINYDLFLEQIQNDYKNINKPQDEIADDHIEISAGDLYKPIKKVELSNRGELVYTNIDRIIKNAGRNLSREEIEYLIYKLLINHIE